MISTVVTASGWSRPLMFSRTSPGLRFTEVEMVKLNKNMIRKGFIEETSAILMDYLIVKEIVERVTD